MSEEDGNEEERFRAETEALRAAIEELTRTIGAIDLAAQRQDEQAVVNAVALAGPAFGWPDRPTLADTATQVPRSLGDLWTQVGNLALSIESLTRLTVPIWTSHAELQRAGTVQRQLVPPAETPVPGAVVHSWYQPAAACGGDWWSAHSLDDDRGLIVMGDVTGHGAPAALITAVIRGACDLARMGMRAQLQPNQLLRMLNRVVVEAAKHDFMSTSIAITTAKGKGELQLANAGHRAPLLLSEGEWKLVQSDREPPLGSQPAVSYAKLSIAVTPGDRLVLFTDGVPEAENAQGQQLGERAIRTLCEQSTDDPSGATLRDRLRQLVSDHNRPLRPRDDVTVLVIDIG
ncbi:MAG: PP2C family protein-serine/threonine phosphatase [Myxococcota bacterium]